MKNITNKFFKGLTSRFSATVLLFALSCVATFAGSKMYIRDAETGAVNSFSIIPGEKKTVQVVLENPDDKVSYLEFYVNFNKGLKYVDKSLTKVTDRITLDSHSLIVTKESERCYHFGVISTSATMASSAIKGTNGAILEFEIEADPSYAPLTSTEKKYSFSVDGIVACDATVLEAKPVIINEDEDGVSEPVYVSVLPNVGYAYADQSDVQIRPLGECLVGVSFANTIALTNFQCKVTLPEGLNFSSEEPIFRGDRISENVDVQFREIKDEPNSYILLLSSLTNDAFHDNDGNIFSLNLLGNKTFNTGKVVISDIEVSSPYNVFYEINDVLEYNVVTVTDPSGDGAWTSADITAVANAVLLGTQESVYDANNDGKVSSADITVAASKVLGN